MSKKMEHFSYKGGCGERKRMCIKAFKRRAGLGYRLTASGYYAVIKCYLKQLYH